MKTTQEEMEEKNVPFGWRMAGAGRRGGGRSSAKKRGGGGEEEEEGEPSRSRGMVGIFDAWLVFGPSPFGFQRLLFGRQLRDSSDHEHPLDWEFNILIC